ncbi:hypothetical protein H072_317 [Dactylellina haptotyla CBS 200.50]|uniref:Uncharacterized protein n=1 Tax=Dactylellina haptotyla (strain CBS 200.50) TaxID=1284197 RepID=S8AS32_DACHA|nr:hypothetical protein H072_317 [Dactylellina haptotyla CBS 200.50]
MAGQSTTCGVPQRLVTHVPSFSIVTVNLDHNLTNYTTSPTSMDPWSPLGSAAPRNHANVIQGVASLGNKLKPKI